MEYFREKFEEAMDEQGLVSVGGFEWMPVVILKGLLSADDYETHFRAWIGDTKKQIMDKAKEFLREYGCLERFNRLRERHENRSVIPFIGAGLSQTSGFPLWEDFMMGLTSDHPRVVNELRTFLEGAQYEEAAQLLFERMGQGVFSENIENMFGVQRPVKGSVLLLPYIFQSGCITTNFDYMLENVYGDSGHGFHAVFSGVEVPNASETLASQPHCLMRLHGEADRIEGRVLTKAEYDACYGEHAIYGETLKNIIKDNSLLFMGCSLSVDRTVQMLRDIKIEVGEDGPRHYAFLPFVTDNTAREDRRLELGEANIHPVWYPPDNHDQAIEGLLISLLEGGFYE